MKDGIIKGEGISLDYHRNIYKKRSDMSNYLIHLTKPSKEELKKIRRENISNGDKIEEINSRAVDNLIKILKEECIYGSRKDGYITNGDKKAAACFQQLPYINLKENVDITIENFMQSSSGRLRYCGVGIAFDKFIIYQYGGRPVIYEESETAKELLNFNENEYWRIANLKLYFYEPIEYDIDPAEMNLEFTEYEQENSETGIVDFMYEREWRIPNDFKFDLAEDLTLEKNMHLIFPTRATYDYFVEQIDDPYAEQNRVWENYCDEDIYQEDKLDDINNGHMDYFYDSYDEIYHIPQHELFKEEFLSELEWAKELDAINLNFKLIGYNKHLKIKFVILDELDFSTNG